MNSSELPTSYQKFIALSRYARWIEFLQRRENYHETVDRYIDNVVTSVMRGHIGELSQEDLDVISELRQGIYDLEAMPSMRAMMTAGPALDRDNTAGFNCAFLVVDNIHSFRETMIILSNGTGVGFSVENKFVCDLPEVAETMTKVPTQIIVEDFKESWADALHQLISLLFSGIEPSWDTTRVRKAGTPLKTFGGRASGPEPLEDLFHFVVKVFREARGRQLKTQECHDIMCKIAQVIVVGGVRRSAMISLSDLDDAELRIAKEGEWYIVHPERALSNNSVAYDHKPNEATFWEEWQALIKSGSGERGIFNREAAQRIIKKHGRRMTHATSANDPSRWEKINFGTNPCSEIILRPYQFCNLTEAVIRPKDTVEDIKEKIRKAVILGTIQSTLTHFPNLRSIWKKNTEEERLLGVSLTGIMDNPLMTRKNSGLEATLDYFRGYAVEVNRIWANKLGINQSVAITCVKPSGTVSQMVDSASGIHTRFAPYYLRTVRNDNKDPVTLLMKDQGVYWEPNVMEFFSKGGLAIVEDYENLSKDEEGKVNNNSYVFDIKTKTLLKEYQVVGEEEYSSTVFYFPMKAPDKAVFRHDINAIDQLKTWLVYQDHWCEHKPSVTISVEDHEWEEVGKFVYEHFDKMSGVSFLPYDGGTYQQAPYAEISEEEYREWSRERSVEVDWSLLSFYESTDMTKGSQELACVAGGCEI